MKAVSKEMQMLIDAAFAKGFGGNRFSFILSLDVLCQGRKMFYFHDAKVIEWGMSVFSSPFSDNPVRVTLESASGLRLNYVKGAGIRITNTKRFRPSYSHGCVKKVAETYIQSIVNENMLFYKV